MEKGTFFGGIITGAIITIVGLALYGSCRGNSDDPIYFDKPAESINERSFKVLQVLELGAALVNGEDDPERQSSYKTYFGVTYLLVMKDKYFSDDEIITLGNDEVARKVGVYNYNTQLGEKTVSIIEIMKK